jgi:uncharacterized iron-regulated protein
MFSGLLLIALQAAAGQAQPAGPPPVHGSVLSSGYVPERVYDSDGRRFSDFEAMLSELARADVVLVGEQHDDFNTHRLERAMLEGLLRRRADVVVSLEMFERDVQPALDDYLAGRIDERHFLEASRPWPRYAGDYAPLVEFARGHGWPVIAANVPRRLAALVAKGGLQALGSLAPQDRELVGASIECPRDDYREAFVESMSSHPEAGPAGMSDAEREAMHDRYYFSQCVKDETMAEAIATAAAREGEPLVVHFNGAFHSDFRRGVVPRVGRRLGGADIVVVSIVPVGDLDAVNPGRDERRRADYLVYTLAQPVRHLRDHVREHGDRAAGPGHVVGRDALDRIGRRMVDEEVVAVDRQ